MQLAHVLTPSVLSLVTSARSAASFTRQATSRRFVHDSQRVEHQCPFAFLGLDRSVSAEELRGRYIQLAKCLHPDAFGGEAAQTTSAFIDLRRAYEAAVELQQCEGSSPPTRPADGGRPSSWGMSAGPQSPEQTCKTATARRREWEKDQEARRAFWVARDAQQPLRHGDAAYAAAMASLLRFRLDAENVSHSQASTVDGTPAVPAESGEHAAGCLPSAAQGQRELEAELRYFGLSKGSQDWYVSWFGRFRCGRPPRSRVWTSRREPSSLRPIGCLAALAAGVTMITVAVASPGARRGERSRERMQ